MKAGQLNLITQTSLRHLHLHAAVNVHVVLCRVGAKTWTGKVSSVESSTRLKDQKLSLVPFAAAKWR